jgi:hypothetical protein
VLERERGPRHHDFDGRGPRDRRDGPHDAPPPPPPPAAPAATH